MGAWQQPSRPEQFRYSSELVGAEAGDAAGDVAVGAAAAVSVLVPVQGGLHAVPEEEELVPGRQHVGLTDFWELKPHLFVDAGFVEDDIKGGDAGVVDDAHRGVGQGDADDLEGAVAVEEQPRAAAMAGVAGEVELRPGAVGVPEAEGVRHAHVAAGVVAVVGQRYRRRSHRTVGNGASSVVGLTLAQPPLTPGLP